MIANEIEQDVQHHQQLRGEQKRAGQKRRRLAGGGAGQPVQFVGRIDRTLEPFNDRSEARVVVHLFLPGDFPNFFIQEFRPVGNLDGKLLGQQGRGGHQHQGHQGHGDAGRQVLAVDVQSQPVVNRIRNQGQRHGPGNRRQKWGHQEPAKIDGDHRQPDQHHGQSAFARKPADVGVRRFDRIVLHKFARAKLVEAHAVARQDIVSICLVCEGSNRGILAPWALAEAVEFRVDGACRVSAREPPTLIPGDWLVVGRTRAAHALDACRIDTLGEVLRMVFDSHI